MDGMFDHNHDGKLSSGERMERDYFVTEMMDHSDHTSRPYRPSDSGNGGSSGASKLLGVLFFIIGFASFLYFPVFSLLMFGLAIYLLVK